MSSDIEELKQALHEHRQRAWKPITYALDGDITDSKFSGTPWLAEKENWPICTHCKRPLQFFLQLNLNDLPEELQDRFGIGIIQLFYCVSWEEEDCDSWEAFSNSHLVRLVDPTDAHRLNIEVPADAFPAKRIGDWLAFEDHPTYAEFEVTGISWPEDDTIAEAVEDMTAKDGDKLAGWPSWVQGVEYPDCPQCQTRMQLVFQLDSEDNLPYMFGDTGIGHITQCPNHKEVLAFAWACC